MGAKRTDGALHSRHISGRQMTLFAIIFVLLAAFLYYLAVNGIPDVTSISPSPAPGNIEYHFIDVGQGDAILIRTADGDILVDTGPNVSESALRGYLRRCGVRSFEYVILTHPHEDHIGNADMIIDEYTVKKLLLSPIQPKSAPSDDPYDYLVSSLEDTTVCRAACGQTFSVGSLRLTVLSPVESDYTDENAFSIVLMSEFGDTRVILCADATSLNERQILNQNTLPSLDCDLLKLGHHGSDTSSCSEWLDALSPGIAVISCGAGNTSGHPSASVTEALSVRRIKTYRTDIIGSIVFVSNGRSITYRNK